MEARANASGNQCDQIWRNYATMAIFGRFNLCTIVVPTLVTL